MKFLVAAPALLLVAVMAVGATLIANRRDRVRRPRPSDEGGAPEHPPRRASLPGRLDSGAAPPRLAGCVPPPGGGCVRGRVELDAPALASWRAAHGDEPFAWEKLDVEVIASEPDDDQEATVVGVRADGSFELRQPAGEYELRARTTAPPLLVARLAALTIRGGASDGALIVSLQPALSVTGQVRGPHGLPIADADVEGQPMMAGAASVQVSTDRDGGFRLEGLFPAAIDLTATAGGFRATTVRGVPPDAGAVVVNIERAPVILGAVGRRGDGACPPTVIIASANDESTDVPVDSDDCTFMLDDAPEGALTIEAPLRGGGAHATLFVPPHGDPPPVCVGPPCGPFPAAVSVRVVDGAGRLVTGSLLSWSLADDHRGDAEDDAASQSSGGVFGVGFMTIAVGAPGRRLQLTASRDDQDRETTLVTTPGVTETVLTLP